MLSRSAGTVGVDIGGTKLLMVIREKSGSNYIERTVPTGPTFSAKDAEQAIEDFISDLGIDAADLGIAIPGLVNETGAVVACDVLPGLKGWQPKETLARKDRYILVMNDLEAALRGEMHSFGFSVPDMALVMVGTAVGAAFFSEGNFIRGGSGWAGELGYLPMTRADGSVGRLDELAGGASIAAGLGLSGAELAQAAKDGDEKVLASIASGGHALGLGLATVINLLNPQHLFLGGGTWALPGYPQAALKSAKAHTIPELWANCEIRDVTKGRLAVALWMAGTAAMIGSEARLKDRMNR